MRSGGKLSRGVIALVLLAVACVMLLPIVFTLFYSFFSAGEIKSYLGARDNYEAAKWLPVLVSPKMFSLTQYYTVLIKEPMYLRLFLNSVVYTGSILLGQMLVVPMMAFALSCFRFRGRGLLFFIILILMLLPFQVTMMPNVIMLRAMRLMDTRWAVIIPMWFAPFYVFLIRQFMISVPGELLEAGGMDGAGPLRLYMHVMMPVCRPILGAFIALSFADCWNMVEQPLVYLSNQAMQPLSVMFNQINVDKAEIAFAGAALYILPALLCYFYFQEDILMGVQLSELK